MHVLICQKLLVLFRVVWQPCVVFWLTVTLVLSPVTGYAQSILTLPPPGQMVSSSSVYHPIVIKGMTLDPNQPLALHFIIDTGDDDGSRSPAILKDQSEQLIRYFLAALAVPDDDVWVNLAPDEHDRIMPGTLAQTELGDTLLSQDYLLKQFSASLMDPDQAVGKEFWSRVYARAQRTLGTTTIPVDAFNKVWIMPEQARVYVHNNTVYITESSLDVLLDQDYVDGQPCLNEACALTTQVMREVLLPEIKREVNQGRHFAPVRQIYHAMILASWYRDHLKEAVINQVFTGRNNLAGLDRYDPRIRDDLYQQYMTAYRQGVVNQIKEEYDPVSETVMPRRYFSGGAFEGLPSVDVSMTVKPEEVQPHGRFIQVDTAIRATTATPALNDDQALIANNELAAAFARAFIYAQNRTIFNASWDYYQHTLVRFLNGKEKAKAVFDYINDTVWHDSGEKTAFTTSLMIRRMQYQGLVKAWLVTEFLFEVNGFESDFEYEIEAEPQLALTRMNALGTINIKINDQMHSLALYDAFKADTVHQLMTLFPAKIQPIYKEWGPMITLWDKLSRRQSNEAIQDQFDSGEQITKAVQSSRPGEDPIAVTIQMAPASEFFISHFRQGRFLLVVDPTRMVGSDLKRVIALVDEIDDDDFATQFHELMIEMDVNKAFVDNNASESTDSDRGQVVRDADAYGGIDLKQSSLVVEETGTALDLQTDQAMVSRLLDQEPDGMVPVVTHIHYAPNVLHLLGL